MTLRLYMDVHIKDQVTRQLRRRGVDVLTAQEDAARRMDDAALLQRATALGRVLYSQDEDLLAETALCLQQGRGFSGLFYSRQLAITIGQSVQDLELAANVYDPEDMANRVEYLPLR